MSKFVDNNMLVKMVFDYETKSLLFVGVDGDTKEVSLSSSQQFDLAKDKQVYMWEDYTTDKENHWEIQFIQANYSMKVVLNNVRLDPIKLAKVDQNEHGVIYYTELASELALI